MPPTVLKSCTGILGLGSKQAYDIECVKNTVVCGSLDLILQLQLKFQDQFSSNACTNTFPMHMCVFMDESEIVVTNCKLKSS